MSSDENYDGVDFDTDQLDSSLEDNEGTFGKMASMLSLSQSAIDNTRVTTFFERLEGTFAQIISTISDVSWLAELILPFVAGIYGIADIFGISTGEISTLSADSLNPVSFKKDKMGIQTDSADEPIFNEIKIIQAIVSLLIDFIDIAQTYIEVHDDDVSIIPNDQNKDPLIVKAGAKEINGQVSNLRLGGLKLMLTSFNTILNVLFVPSYVLDVMADYFVRHLD